jgi:hypothetical protein
MEKLYVDITRELVKSNKIIADILKIGFLLSWNEFVNLNLVFD